MRFGSGRSPKLSPDEQWLQEMSATYARNAKYAASGPYTTQLTPEQEQTFRQWVSTNKVPFNPGDVLSDYDMRGYWSDVAAKGGADTAVNPYDHQLHFPDTYKTPYHKSFSAESKYAKGGAPIWVNDHQLVDPNTGQVIFDEAANSVGRR
jgi:hypothetical protein